MARYNPAKNEELKFVGEKYQQMKSMRNALIAKKMAEVEAELQLARESFADYLQELYLREDYPYRVSVADLARAMGTSSRNTVYEYLGDAKERKSSRFMDRFTHTDPFELSTLDTDNYGIISMLILETSTGIRYRVGKGQQPNTAIVTEWNTELNKWSSKMKTVHLDETVPEIVEWATAQPEWAEVN